MYVNELVSALDPESLMSVLKTGLRFLAAAHLELSLRGSNGQQGAQQKHGQKGDASHLRGALIMPRRSPAPEDTHSFRDGGCVRAWWPRTAMLRITGMNRRAPRRL